MPGQPASSVYRQPFSLKLHFDPRFIRYATCDHTTCTFGRCSSCRQQSKLVCLLLFAGQSPRKTVANSAVSRYRCCCCWCCIRCWYGSAATVTPTTRVCRRYRYRSAAPFPVRVNAHRKYVYRMPRGFRRKRRKGRFLFEINRAREATTQVKVDAGRGRVDQGRSYPSASTAATHLAKITVLSTTRFFMFSSANHYLNVFAGVCRTQLRFGT